VSFALDTILSILWQNNGFWIPFGIFKLLKGKYQFEAIVSNLDIRRNCQKYFRNAIKMNRKKNKTKKTKNQKNQTMSDWYDNVYLTTHYCYYKWFYFQAFSIHNSYCIGRHHMKKYDRCTITDKHIRWSTLFKFQIAYLVSGRELYACVAFLLCRSINCGDGQHINWQNKKGGDGNH
jgi:hypothetical protein